MTEENEDNEQIERIETRFSAFASAAHAAEFRRALKNLPSDAHIERSNGRTTLCLRPHDLLAFGAALNGRGLQQCECANRLLRHPDRRKDSFIRFEHRGETGGN